MIALITILVPTPIIILYFTLVNVRNTGEKKPSDCGWNYEEFRVESSDKITLRTWFIDQLSNTTIIMAHGYRSCMNCSDLCNNIVLKNFISKGFNVLLFDFRAYGKSDGKFTTIGFKEGDDIVFLAKWLKETKPDKSQTIIVFGTSMGAAATIFALSRTDLIDLAIVDSTYGNLSITVRRALGPLKVFYPLLRLWARIIFKIDSEKISTISVTKNIKSPVLIMIGEEDEIMDLDEVFRLYKQLKEEGKDVKIWVAKMRDIPKGVQCTQKPV